jgi:hypothetical protein|tara:strand:- start:3314 stop:4156 length:843 start_codon:yes stop_codon:yes gene_type:complete
MISWIASYPKSGNTFIRSFLASYLFSDTGKFDFDLLYNILQFPSLKFSKTDLFSKKDAAQNWIYNQNFFFNNKDTFLKTHNTLIEFEGYKFTSPKQTKGAIYIVRDPRNVVLSMSHHYSLTYEESFEKMINNEASLLEKTFNNDHSNFTFLGSWSNHYKSWRDNNEFKVLFLKYEDFEENAEKEFKKILSFIYELKNEKFIINDKKFSNALKSTNFTNLKNKENIYGFEESIYSDKGKKLNFFNFGFQNKWQKKLPNDIVKKINLSLKNEIIELGYNINE